MSAVARGSSRIGMLGLVALMVTGAGHALVMPPWGPQGGLAVHPILWVPALPVFSRLRGPRAFLAGWLTGFALHVVAFSWLFGTLERYAGFGPALSFALLLLFAAAHGLVCGVFACGVAPIRRVAGAAWPVVLAAWFVACEHWSPQMFPHFQGAWWVPVTAVFLASALTGVAGIGFVVLWSNALLLQWWDRLRDRGERGALASNALAFGVAVVLVFGAAAWQEARVSSAESRSRAVRFALVQPNFDSASTVPIGSEEYAAQVRRLVAMSAQALDAHPGIDAVVWPESVLTGHPDQRANHPALRLAHEREVELWTGSLTRGPGAGRAVRIHNSAFRIRARAEIDPPYHKRRLVPFSEAMPIWLPPLRSGFGWVSPGSGLGVAEAEWGRFAFLICYEAILERSVREATAARVSLLVNLTHDGWFGDTAGPHRYLMLARAQAAQVGVPLVRATTTGFSALIDARGALAEHGSLFEVEVIVGELGAMCAPWLYARLGPWFAWLCTAAAGWVLAMAARRR